jgi:hypothetical protein
MRVIFWFVIAALEAGWCGSARVTMENSTRVRLRMQGLKRVISCISLISVVLPCSQDEPNPTTSQK